MADNNISNIENCPNCGSDRITMHMQAVLYKDINVKTGKSFKKAGSSIRELTQKEKAMRYDFASGEGVGVWSFECRRCGWTSEEFTE